MQKDIDMVFQNHTLSITKRVNETYIFKSKALKPMMWWWPPLHALKDKAGSMFVMGKDAGTPVR